MIWEPRDTHPGYSFRVNGVDPETGRWVCVLATLDGVVLSDPKAVCDKVYAEHAAVNQAVAVIASELPPEMLKPVLDSDGDPVFDDAGSPVMVVKDKHQPIISPSPLGEVTGVAIPGTREFPGLTSKQCDDLSKTVATALATNELVQRLQPLSGMDLAKSVVLRAADEATAREG